MNTIRKNLMMAVATFIASDGSGVQPGGARLIINYRDKSNVVQNMPIDMSLDVLTQTWRATWDTSVAGRGTVQWAIYGYGDLQAATEGCFEIEANAANLFAA